MKKALNLSVIFAVLMAAFSFSSCSKDEDAATITIHFNQNGEFGSGDAAVATITSLDESLKTIELWSEGSKLKNIEIPNDNDGVYVVSIPELEDGAYLLKVTSSTGAAEKDFTVGEVGGGDGPQDTPLSAAAAFTWTRTGAAAGTGLEQFGLAWTSNSATSAIITAPGTKLVKLNASEWSSLTTQEALAEAIDAADGITKYEGVSVTSPSKSYTDVLGTKTTDGEYFLIHVTNSTVTSSSNGTSVIITGQYKN